MKFNEGVDPEEIALLNISRNFSYRLDESEDHEVEEDEKAHFQSVSSSTDSEEESCDTSTGTQKYSSKSA